MPEPGHGYRDAIRPYWEKVSIYRGAAVFTRQFAAVPRPLGHLLATHWCQSEVRNGGLDQFFVNSTGVLAPEAVAGFAALGMPRTSALIADAMKQLGTPYPRNRAPRQRILDRISAKGDPFHALDEALFKSFDAEAGGFELVADRYAALAAAAPPPGRLLH